MVDQLQNPDVDCIISGADITHHQILVRVPKINEIPGIIPELHKSERIISTASAEKRSYYLSAITRSEGKRQHISELFDFEQDDMGEPEKED